MKFELSHMILKSFNFFFDKELCSRVCSTLFFLKINTRFDKKFKIITKENANVNNKTVITK